MTLLARASAGMLWWAFGFSLLYALHGMGCARGWDQTSMAGGSLLRWILSMTWLTLLCGAVAIIRWACSRPATFERTLAVASAVVGFVSILVTGSPVILTSACHIPPLS